MDILKFAGRRNCILEKVIKNHSIMILAIDGKMKVVVEKIESNSSDDLSRLGFCNENRNTYIFKRIYEKICDDIESADLLVERLAEDIRNGKNIERKRVVNAIDIIKEDASNKINVKDAFEKVESFRKR